MSDDDNIDAQAYGRPPEPTRDLRSLSRDYREGDLS